MRQNIFAWLVGILIIAILAAYIDLSDSVPVKGDIRWKLGLDLQGGIQLVLKAEPRGDKALTRSDLENARDILEERANATGASEPVVQIAGTDRILVELPGIEDIEAATNIIRQTAFLEIVSSGDVPLTEGQLICTRNGGAPRAEQQKLDAASASSTTPITATSGLTSTQTVSGTTTAQTTPATTPAPSGLAACTKIYETIVDGGEIDGGKVSVVYNNGLPQVSFTLKGDGPSKFAKFTRDNVNKYMPIVLDNKVVSSPIVKGIIPGGEGVIEGMSIADAKKLSIQLKYGALPIGLSLQESRKISATLGADAISKSIIAGIIGLGLVALFMVLYYRLPGVLSVVALVVYSLITLALFKLVPVTLTLAGIAGFILSIGMAVDANVLIFSRLKEELRLGKTLPAAVEAGFDHAWPSIRDSNVSTMLTCVILFWFGSTFGGASIIKGFALTLLIGVLVSMFSAILVTRTFLRSIIRTGLAKNKWAFDIDDRKTAVTTTPVTES